MAPTAPRIGELQPPTMARVRLRDQDEHRAAVLVLYHLLDPSGSQRCAVWAAQQAAVVALDRFRRGQWLDVIDSLQQVGIARAPGATVTQLDYLLDAISKSRHALMRMAMLDGRPAEPWEQWSRRVDQELERRRA